MPGQAQKMSTRYSRYRGDGTAEHYDSAAERDAAEKASSDENIRSLFAMGGLVLAGIGMYWLTQHYVPEWPKAIRFGLVVGGVIAGAVVSSMLALIVVRI